MNASAVRDAVRGTWLRQPSEADTAGVVIDSRCDVARRVFVAIKGDRFDGNEFAGDVSKRGAAIVIVDRDVGELPGSAGVLRVDDGRRALADLATAWRRAMANTRVVAVTGSAGKTSTRRLIDGVLGAGGGLRGSASPKSFNNDIGVPLTILAARLNDEYLVAEIGMNRPGEIAMLAAIAQPNVAVITMIGRAHLAGLGSVEAIAQEKSTLVDALPPDGVAIINGDSELLERVVGQRRFKGRLVRFGAAPMRSLDLRLTARRVDGAGQEIEVNGRERFALRMPGEHNAINALAAIATGRAFGLSDDAIRCGLASVEPSAMRLERVDVPFEGGALSVFNDAYNANPDAMIASIKAFAELAESAPRRVLVLGDMLELGDAAADLHREVGSAAAQVHRATRLDVAILVGAFAKHTMEGLMSAGWKGESLVLPALDATSIEAASSLFRAGDALLLKGSRGAAMERLLMSLKQQSPARSA